MLKCLHAVGKCITFAAALVKSVFMIFKVKESVEAGKVCHISWQRLAEKPVKTNKQCTQL